MPADEPRIVLPEPPAALTGRPVRACGLLTSHGLESMTLIRVGTARPAIEEDPR
jgi:hypothetical protein